MVIEKDNAILDLRTLMGATNPANAAEGTIRKTVRRLHPGECDSRIRRRRTAAFEIGYWFAGYELI